MTESCNVTIKEKREHTRLPYVKPIRYSVTVSHRGVLEESDNDGVSVDISKGGLGMITDCNLTTGDILFFEHGIKFKRNTMVKTSIVRWAKGIQDNRYRVGLQFFAYIDKDHILHF